jgi:hypothetical protein
MEWRATAETNPDASLAHQTFFQSNAIAPGI